MKRLTPKRSIPYFFVPAILFFSGLPSGKLIAQATITADHAAVMRPIPPAVATVFLDKSGTNTQWNSGSGNYVWSVSPAAGVTFGSYDQYDGTNNNTCADVVVTFGAAALPGNYTFTLTRGGSFTRTLTILVGNLAAANSSNDISTFAVNTLNGNLLVASPGNIFNPTVNTAALGLDELGRFYYIPNTTSNSGVMELWGTDVNGDNAVVIDPSTDFNGSSTSSIGFVRLAMRDDNKGFILAGDNSTMYVAEFTGNGTAAASITGITPVSLLGGNLSEFQNGDICFSGSGMMFALANDGAGNTYIYTASPPYTTLTKKWTLVGPGGAAFSGQVNGCAFDAAGSMYISGSSSGIYYIDQSTVNNFGSGTVVTTQKWSGTGVTDLASNVFPQFTTLPVKLGSFEVSRQGTGALLKWTTLSEVNNERFEIERSEDGIRFHMIGSVIATGNNGSGDSYRFTDPLTLVSGKIVYYRLRDVAYDGKGTYSKIIALKLDGSAGASEIAVYPNPFTRDVKLAIGSNSETRAIIRISNMAGQQVFSRKIRLQPGENIIVLNDLGMLAPGIHVLELITDEKKVVQKIVKN